MYDFVSLLPVLVRFRSFTLESSVQSFLVSELHFSVLSTVSEKLSFSASIAEGLASVEGSFQRSVLVRTIANSNFIFCSKLHLSPQFSSSNTHHTSFSGT